MRVPKVDRENLEQTFGRINVLQWADVDNETDEDIINARIDVAIETGVADLLSALGENRFIWTTVEEDYTHPILMWWAKVLSAYYLYQSRVAANRITDSETMEVLYQKFREFCKDVYENRREFPVGLDFDKDFEYLPIIGSVDYQRLIKHTCNCCKRCIENPPIPYTNQNYPRRP